ncbi:MAG: aminotransferase class V-fold PLP-dependent enzyme [Gammaproteobacteria bacterium]|nr:aminotransferase class V-fold PLP-dependent enzyme [Gammaproteobacteria bacterium]
MQPIYLDYAATTPIDPKVAEKMIECLISDSQFGNPSSAHILGQNAKQAVDQAREEVAHLIHAHPNEIIWTSGATEANNLALKGAASLYQGKGKHIITLKTEHPSILDCCQYLEKQGFSVTYLTPEKNGLLDIAKLENAIRPDTILISVMHVNNEIGVIQDIQKIAEITYKNDILFHVDAAQSAGKIPIDMQKTPIDLLSFCAHKMYGPKGIGALYLRRMPRRRVAAQIHGGGQEQGIRSGTLATHQIVGMGTACALMQSKIIEEAKQLSGIRQLFLEKLNKIQHVRVNGDILHSYPGIINICFPNFSADNLMKKMPNLAISAGSACSSKGTEPSYVLRAIGLNEKEASSSLRFSFGRFTTIEDIDLVFSMLESALYP